MKSPFVDKPFKHGLRGETKRIRRALDRVAAVWPSWRIIFDAIDLGCRNIPGSALSRWFNERVSRSGGRGKKVAIVALARELLIALWKYAVSGVVIEGPS